jgi:hypothetical protein
VEEDVQVTGNRLNMDPLSPECSPLKDENKIELVDICLTIMYFQVDSAGF